MFREHGNPPVGPLSEGEKTNPADNDVLADTGVINATYPTLCEIIVTVGASATADVAVQHRNAANDGNITSVVLKVTTQSAQYRFLYRVAAGERVRVNMDDALTGTIAASVNYEIYG